MQPGERRIKPWVAKKGSSTGTDHVLQVNEGVIDGHNFHLLGGESSTSHQTADAAESEKKTKRELLDTRLQWGLGLVPARLPSGNTKPHPNKGQGSGGGAEGGCVLTHASPRAKVEIERRCPNPGDARQHLLKRQGYFLTTALNSRHASQSRDKNRSDNETLGGTAFCSKSGSALE